MVVNGSTSNARARLAVAACLAVAFFAPSAQALDVREVDDAGERFELVQLDLAHDRLELHWQDDSGHALTSIEGLRAWAGARGRELVFAANAGIYDRAFKPLGLHVEEGVTRRALNTASPRGTIGNFSLQPNGVFYVDHAGNAGVMTTQAWQAHAPDARIASQSGPMLVVDGEVNAAFDSASQSEKIRSGVCAPSPHHVVFAVSETPVTFHRFASLMRDEAGCRDALFLDGTLSQLWTKQTGYVGAPAVMLKPYVGIFAVFGEPAEKGGN